MNKRTRAAYAQQLHAIYDDVIMMPLPWHLIDRLCQLEELEATPPTPPAIGRIIPLGEK
jgi:hypothetical protein